MNWTAIKSKTIRLFYLENKCHNEITEMTGMDWNRVRSLIQNGRRNLKNCMEKMPEREFHINYSIEDIERYLNGNMTAKEMHELERAALNDPLLADAIEGYSEKQYAHGPYSSQRNIRCLIHSRRKAQRLFRWTQKEITGWTCSRGDDRDYRGWQAGIFGLNKSEGNQPAPAVAGVKQEQITAGDSSASKSDSSIIVAQLNKAAAQKPASQNSPTPPITQKIMKPLQSRLLQ